jgi:hypothetical protein
LEGRISKLSLNKENKLKEGSRKLTKEREVSYVFGKEKEENENVRKKLVLMCGRLLFIKKMCANKSMEGSCV